jgi:hypothetical protein
MQKLTTRQFESRLLRAVRDHRCEITGVKFQAGLLNHERYGGQVSEFDFDPSGAILAKVGFNCGYEPRR